MTLSTAFPIEANCVVILNPFYELNTKLANESAEYSLVNKLVAYPFCMTLHFIS